MADRFEDSNSILIESLLENDENKNTQQSTNNGHNTRATTKKLKAMTRRR